MSSIDPKELREIALRVAREPVTAESWSEALRMAADMIEASRRFAFERERGGLEEGIAGAAGAAPLREHVEAGRVPGVTSWPSTVKTRVRPRVPTAAEVEQARVGFRFAGEASNREMLETAERAMRAAEIPPERELAALACLLHLGLTREQVVAGEPVRWGPQETILRRVLEPPTSAGAPRITDRPELVQRMLEEAAFRRWGRYPEG